MKVTIVAGLSAKRNMYIDSRHGEMIHKLILGLLIWVSFNGAFGQIKAEIYLENSILEEKSFNDQLEIASYLKSKDLR
jgi:hypothetical protein